MPSGLRHLHYIRLPQPLTAPSSPPVGSPQHRGVSLVTNFTIQATGWTDPEADLPLSYAYYADGLRLADATESSTLHVSASWPHLAVEDKPSPIYMLQRAFFNSTWTRPSYPLKCSSVAWSVPSPQTLLPPVAENTTLALEVTDALGAVTSLSR